MDEFAPDSSPCTSFIVQNITTEPKVVNIFNYPILPGGLRNLLLIPGVSEGDIRASLLKGTLRHKLLAQDIQIIFSDLDLLQFNLCEYAFLSNAGINIGLTVTPAQTSGFAAPSSVNYALQQNIALSGIKNGKNRTFFTPAPFLDGAFQGNVFHIEVFHNGRKLINGLDFSISVTGRVISGFNTINFLSFSPTALSEIYANYYVFIT